MMGLQNVSGFFDLSIGCVVNSFQSWTIENIVDLFKVLKMLIKKPPHFEITNSRNGDHVSSTQSFKFLNRKLVSIVSHSMPCTCFIFIMTTVKKHKCRQPLPTNF